MILWNILLSVFLAASIAINVYVFLKGKQNTEAILTIIGPDLEKQKAEIIKIKKQL